MKTIKELREGKCMIIKSHCVTCGKVAVLNDVLELIDEMLNRNLSFEGKSYVIALEELKLKIDGNDITI